MSKKISALYGLPKKGEIAFVHYYEEQAASNVVKRAKGSPFKSIIVRVDFKEIDCVSWTSSRLLRALFIFCFHK